MSEHPSIEDAIPGFREVLESMQGVKTDHELIDQLRENIIPIGELTLAQAHEQRINLCLGMASRNSGITRAHIEKMISEGRF